MIALKEIQDEKRRDRSHAEKTYTYKTKFMVVVLVKRGPSSVGKLQVLKIPP